MAKDENHRVAIRPNGVSRIVGAVVNPVVGAVEFDDVLDKIDLNAMLERIDLDALIERVDLDAVIERVDLDAVIERVDLDAVIQRVDIDALMRNLDIQAIIVQANVKGIMASKATRILHLIRARLVRADVRSRDLLRQVLRRPAITDTTDATAGPFTRLPAYLIDTSIISVGFSIGLAVCTYLLGAFLGHDVELDASGIWFALGFSLVTVLYFWLSTALTGQTIGKAVLGVRIVRGDGGRLGAGAALLRVVMFPFAFLFFGLGFAPIALARRHRALYDAVADTVVVYDET